MQLLGGNCHISEGTAALARSRCTRSSFEKMAPFLVVKIPNLNQEEKLTLRK
jgi:hypothetical protein